jgi:G:T/U-mismatch repair DNA glycosylase
MKSTCHKCRGERGKEVNEKQQQPNEEERRRKYFVYTNAREAGIHQCMRKRKREQQQKERSRVETEGPQQ